MSSRARSRHPTARVRRSLFRDTFATPSMRKPTAIMFDAESTAWLDDLRARGEVRECALARLHDLLLGVARAEAFRRRPSLPDTVIAELESLCMQAADDALRAITDKLETFRGESRFTTWAYKFAILEISMRLRRSAWHDRQIVLDDAAWERLSDPAANAQQRLEWQELMAALRNAVTEALTRRQRDVFLAVAIEEVPIDVVAERMGTTRGAVYKVLHDARRRLRRVLAEAGHEVSEI
jgi:RNA polymerase sigma-70 factor (ECF subfamily)